MASSKDAVVLDVDGHEVRVSNPEKPYFGDRGIRKIDVVEYFVVGRRGHPVRAAGPADDAGALARRRVRGRPDLHAGGQHRRRVLPEAGAEERPRVGADGAHHLPQRADGGRDRARLGGRGRLVRQPGHADLPPVAGVARATSSHPTRSASTSTRSRAPTSPTRCGWPRTCASCCTSSAWRAGRRPPAAGACTSTCRSSRGGPSRRCAARSSPSAASWNAGCPTA